MAYKYILSLFLLCSVAFCSELRLKEKLAEAVPGSYIVIEQNKTFTFLHIYERTEQNIVLEEVSVPAARFAGCKMSWKEWFENGAPGHTSWIMSQINLNTGVFEETFSFTHQGWIDMSDSNPFMTTLLNLYFKEVPLPQRRRIGLPPGYNKPDYRPVWNPRLTVHGHPIPQVPFAAYKTRWPADGSELSRKIIEIYLPQVQEENVWYPSYFPYWLEVDGKIGSAKVRVVDSGLDAHSPKTCLPRRSPKLTSEAQINEKGLSLHLSAPHYYKEFILLAEETGSFFGKTFPLPCIALREGNGEAVSLFVSKDDLKNHVVEGESYRFIITPKENAALVLETRSSLKIGAL